MNRDQVTVVRRTGVPSGQFETHNPEYRRTNMLRMIRVTTCLAAVLVATATLAVQAAEVMKPNIGEPLRDPRPNIILILCDDAGFADFGYTGGIAETPVLDKMAAQGMRFTRAYSNARCMPTRSSLMAGLNPQVGRDSPLSQQCVTIPEVLKDAGYATYMIGKWHLGASKTPDKRTGLASIPSSRGFDRFYGIWEGAANVNKKKLVQAAQNKEAAGGKGFAPRIIEDGRELPWDEVPDNYYNTITWTDKAIEFIRSTPKDKPFFLYAAYTAPHWPLDPLPESIARYKGKFDEGWDVIRDRIFARQKELGLIPADYPPPPREYGIPPFQPGTKEADTFRNGCPIYYASITEMDEQIGRLVRTVEELGRGKNTLLVFLSDNGADNLIGGAARGNNSNLPFMGYKLTYFEGGARTPLLVWWPGVVPPNAIQKNQQVFLEDFMPTFIELAGARYPTERHGQKIAPLPGRSILRAIQDPAHADPQRTWCWEHDGQRGVWQGEWKAIMIEKRHPIGGTWGGTKDGWYLYRASDRQPETEDLAAAHPEKLKELIGVWREWAQSVQWSPSPRFGLHPTDAANGIADYGAKK